MNTTREKIHFVTGRLAAPMLRRLLQPLSHQADFEYSIDELPISVAALMTTAWIAKHIQVPAETQRVVIPGMCEGDTATLESVVHCRVDRGPKDLHRLPEFFSQRPSPPVLDQWQIEIIAEINYAPELATEELVATAQRLVDDGADLVDLGCIPGYCWKAIGSCVARLRDAGIRVSVDSFDPDEVTAATAAGAELVLSVHQANRKAATEWGAEVVVIPDSHGDIESMFETAEWLAEQGVRCRLDPVIDPIGMGFANALIRYWQVRQRFPDWPMMMGVGNITELTEVDSAGVNLLLAAICQEWSIHSVLTTEVIHWARSSVRELEFARRLVWHAVTQGALPKGVDSRLVMLRDPDVRSLTVAEIQALSRQIRDLNYRIFSTPEQLYLLGGERCFHHRDPFELFDQMMQEQSESMSPEHAFYLGFELCKAALARQLGKEYRQDESLNWGLLTEAEPPRHRLKKSRKANRRRK